MDKIDTQISDKSNNFLFLPNVCQDWTNN